MLFTVSIIRKILHMLDVWKPVNTDTVLPSMPKSKQGRRFHEEHMVQELHQHYVFTKGRNTINKGDEFRRPGPCHRNPLSVLTK